MKNTEEIDEVIKYSNYNLPGDYEWFSYFIKNRIINMKKIKFKKIDEEFENLKKIRYQHAEDYSYEFAKILYKKYNNKTRYSICGAVSYAAGRSDITVFNKKDEIVAVAEIGQTTINKFYDCFMGELNDSLKESYWFPYPEYCDDFSKYYYLFTPKKSSKYMRELYWNTILKRELEKTLPPQDVYKEVDKKG